MAENTKRVKSRETEIKIEIKQILREEALAKGKISKLIETKDQMIDKMAELDIKIEEMKVAGNPELVSARLSELKADLMHEINISLGIDDESSTPAEQQELEEAA